MLPAVVPTLTVAVCVVARDVDVFVTVVLQLFCSAMHDITFNNNDKPKSIHRMAATIPSISVTIKLPVAVAVAVSVAVAVAIVVAIVVVVIAAAVCVHFCLEFMVRCRTTPRTPSLLHDKIRHDSWLIVIVSILILSITA